MPWCFAQRSQYKRYPLAIVVIYPSARLRASQPGKL
jgi:hypothetical protein